jgi:hypothetical protein
MAVLERCSCLISVTAKSQIKSIVVVQVSILMNTAVKVSVCTGRNGEL